MIVWNPADNFITEIDDININHIDELASFFRLTVLQHKDQF